MIEKYSNVNRKELQQERIAICPNFECTYIKKVKPLIFGIIGFRKYPTCSKHKIPLVFVDEYIGNFLRAVNACLFDHSSIPPRQILNLFKKEAPKSLRSFFQAYLYSAPIGRGALIVPRYMDGLSRTYLKLLSNRQKKLITSESDNKYEMLRSGFKEIEKQYAQFLEKLRTKSEELYNLREIKSFSTKELTLIKTWLNNHLIEIQEYLSKGNKMNENSENIQSLSLLKATYDKILHADTCLLLLGKEPTILSKRISPFELYFAYQHFLDAGLCKELTKTDVLSLFETDGDWKSSFYLEKSTNKNIYSFLKLNIDSNQNIKNSQRFMDKSENKIYDTKDFTDELIEELSKDPKSMSEVNPERNLRRQKGFTMKELSILWDHTSDFVSKKLRRKNNNPKYILPDEDLLDLILKIKSKYGIRANYCLDLIDAHREGALSLEPFMLAIRNELGNISDEIPVTLDELALLFGFSRGHIVRIRANSDFLIDKERLDILKKNCKVLLGNNVKSILKIINKYKYRNPNLPDYAGQQYTIENPNLFGDIFNNPRTLYWFGFLCADGYLTRDGHYRIVIKLQRSDRKIIERFAKFVGFDIERINDGITLFRNERNELKAFENSIIRFCCKTMWRDLESLGIFQFKIDGELPNIIKSLISEAKRKNPSGNLKETKEGRLALMFLLGFYDGDGRWDSGMSAVIFNTKKQFLKQIKQYFESPNDVRRVFNGLIDKETGALIQKPGWALYLGPVLFDGILSSYDNSLRRKRPPSFQS